MAPAPYPDFRWFFRAVRIVPVVAVAALAGGIIGGFSVFAIDLAVTAPPDHDVRADAGKLGALNAAQANGAAPLRTFDAAGPVPAAGTSAPPTPAQARQMQAQQMQAPGTPVLAVTPPLPAPQKVWPDAMSREHQAADHQAVEPQPTELPAAPSQSVAAAPNKPIAPGGPVAEVPKPAAAGKSVAEVPEPTAPQPVAAIAPEHKTVATKRRVAVERSRQLAADESAAVHSARPRRPVYDYYGRDDDQDVNPAPDADAHARYERARPRYVVRRQQREDHDQAADRSDESRDDQSADGNGGLPPQPPPIPLLGGLLFGGDR